MKSTAGSQYSIDWKSGVHQIDKVEWDRLALPLNTPLLEWDWLNLLEQSGSVRPETGWLPCHLTVRLNARLVAAAPLYIKGHSAGEFVFDHAWADLAGRLGIRYYPKMVGMSPFSPVVGYRFLIDPLENERDLTGLMIHAIDRFCRANQITGCSFLFVDPHWRSLVETSGFVSWRHQSFTWENPGFSSFDDYLTLFNSNQRRNIKRERKTLQQLGVRIEALRDPDIPRSFYPLMYAYYARTNDQFGPWGCKYLTPEFFESLHGQFRHRLLLMAAFEARDSKHPVGLSFLLAKRDRLYGRYWGCSRRINHLHFNACYYSPIEWAIRNNIRRFDPGAGSSHKVRRGFKAVANHSLHRFYEPRLEQILRMHIDEINRMEQHHIDELNQELPFSKRSHG